MSSHFVSDKFATANLPMLTVTLDTNVLVSGTFWEGEAYKIFQMIEHRKIKCFLSMGIINEYNKVVHSKEILEKVEEHHLKIKMAMIKVIEICALVEPKTKIDIVKEDSADNKILECALEAKVDYILTYDVHLLKIKQFEGIRISSPTEFLKLHR